jgi:predicted nucleic acid-binding protein
VILADTSIWVDHLRHDDEQLRALLFRGEVVTHPWVIGELALGGLSTHSEARRLVAELPHAVVAQHTEVMHAIDSRALARRGIGYVDAQLIVAVLLTPGSRLWTRDSKLAALAEDIGVGVR